MIRLQVHHPGDHTLIVGYVELDHIDAKAIVELAHPELMCIMTPPSMEARIAELQADKDQIAQVLGAAKWEGPLMAAQRVMAFVRSINDEPPTQHQSAPVDEQAADQGDDAAEEAMKRLLDVPWLTSSSAASGILAAIRRGEVPGISAINQSVFDRRQAELYAEIAALRARAEKAEAQISAAVAVRDLYDNTRADRDRLAAEVEALKSRKVVMPPSVWASEYGVWMLRRCDVHDAIRAAGIAVEEA